MPAESGGAVVTGFAPLGIYHVAVVAEDVNGAWNAAVRSASAQASIDRLGEVRNLTVRCETNALYFNWQAPDFAEAFLDRYHLYLGGAEVPMVLNRGATNYSAPELLPAHGYPLHITTMDKFGTESEGASLLTATLLPHPVNLAAQPFDGMVRLTWDHAEPNELVFKYAVYVAPTNFTSTAGKEPVLLTRARRADLSGLANGATYYFAVTTVNIAGGESSEARTVSSVPAPRGGTFADLLTTNVVAPTVVYPGRPGTFGWQVLNMGTAPTSREDQTPVTAWTDRIILSADDVLGDADDVPIADITRTGSLEAGAGYSTNVSVVLQSAFPPEDTWVNEGDLLSVTNSPVVPDLPGETLRFALDQAPEGMTVDTATGVIAWRPDEAQGPTTNRVAVVVTDTGAPPLSETNQFTVVVGEVNAAPELGNAPDQFVEALAPWTYRLVATDPDLPADGLAFGLVSGPTGLSVSADGRVSWAPTEAQAGTLHLVVGRRGGKSLWLTWRPTVSGVATFSTMGSGFDTLLAVYRGDTLATLQEVASDENRGGFFTSWLTFNAVAGTDYQVAVDGFEGDHGELILAWKLEPEAPSLPEITQSPVSQVVAKDEAVTLEVVSLTPAVTYQWFLNGQELANETQATLSFAAAPERVGSYRARVTGANGAFMDSRDALIEVVPQGISASAGEQVSADKWQDLFLGETLPTPIQLQGRPVLIGFTPVGLGLGGRYTELRGATRSLADPSGCRGGLAGSRWFRFQVDVPRTVKLSLESKEVNATMTVFHAPPAEPAVMGCVRASVNQGAVTGGFLARTNVDYLVMVAVAGGGSGRVLLKWEGEEVEPIIGQPGAGFGEDGRFRSVWPGVPPGNYELRLTADLDQWQQVFQTNVTSTRDLEFVDPELPSSRARFCHLRQATPGGAEGGWRVATAMGWARG